MNRVVITGASGFIGKSLCKALIESKVFTYAIVRDSYKMKDLVSNKYIKIIEADFNCYEQIISNIEGDIDVFYHFAWDGTYGQKLTNYELQLSNVKNTCDTLMLATKLGCKKFIFAGTINQLEIKKYMNMETCEPRLACIYGTSKLACEMMCKTLAYNNNIEFNTAIISSVFGPGDKSKMIQNVLIKKFIDNEKPKLVKGNYLYDWIYIDDVVNMLIEIGKKSVNFREYYIGNIELRTFKDIILEVKNIINPNLEITFGELNDTSVIDYSQINLNSVYEDTGYLPKCDFRESILKTVEWVKTLNF
ncbi:MULTISPECIES: NAD-dependent epimerase/dehydratase family protein [unclassified Clostridioides]|uniref:NAD-dependent epimerase/dehydratase family protein n=1 Tax=unclassified Clostridioides TaxID=2635829 RepID=UPI001D0F75F7|nr:NAD(P)-dependent oxidoreductase [Clostridioides sp. ES-S-0010-02]UDN61177.1 NAD(P)-dependent oxidoreductase [Clostridioides sp. ES-W-0016-02]